ncbi:MAG: hypothetical protein JSU86_10735 [Phycisphaerales bacterium]|nr:MAG: hypothetical protein JSU86_10735 [Phycisphaerales bacterium]
MDAETARRCVACGYNLFGLGDEPRCPECGLLNIPSRYRQQVWDLVGSGRWFFSSFFGPFRKRPPGWWWALDRPGDVKRTFKFTGVYLLITASLIFGAGAVGDAARVEIADKWSNYSYVDPDDPTRSTIVDYEQVSVVGLGGTPRRGRYSQTERHDAADRIIRPFGRRSVRVLIEPSLDFLPLCGIIFAWVFFIWALPAMAGLWTQIRKGLPEFARAPRTILAASNYESHRLLYLGIVFAIWTVADAALRVSVFARTPASLLVLWLLLVLAVTVLGAAGWTGPLRSDYTRQLVRSRRHAARIVVMYAVMLPWVMTIAVVAATWSLSSL